jgi:signal transduction histidine kinase
MILILITRKAQSRIQIQVDHLEVSITNLIMYAKDWFPRHHPLAGTIETDLLMRIIERAPEWLGSDQIMNLIALIGEKG